MRIIVFLILVFWLLGCAGSDDGSTGSLYTDISPTGPFDNKPSGIMTFDSVNGDICREDGKPVIRLFSTTWCGHCQWVSDTFDDVVQMYVDDGLIVARHWKLDIDDDTLTSQVEQAVPDDEMAILYEYNPEGYVPIFIFGCKYYRIGTAYEQENDLDAEANEFIAVIEALLSE
jgi:thiol-disulfide isomerase/thioredoxin